MKNYKLVMEIISLTILINENTELCTFADYSGHVNTLHIRAYPNKDRTTTEFHENLIYNERMYCAMESWMTEDDLIEKLEDAKKFLLDCLLNVDNLVNNQVKIF